MSEDSQYKSYSMNENFIGGGQKELPLCTPQDEPLGEI